MGELPEGKMCFCRSNALIPCSFGDSKINIIVLINGCFHNGPVICPRLVIMAQGRLYWPETIFKSVENITDGWCVPYITGCVVNFNINMK